MTRDGIEVHFDEKRGVLELACEPDAFAPYREIARDQLEGFPEVPIGQVIEIHVVHTAAYVARRDAFGRRIGGLISRLVVAVVLALALVGAHALIARVLS